MTQVQQQKISRFLAFREHIALNVHTFENHPHLKPHFESFNNQLELILNIKDMTEEKDRIKNVSQTREEVLREATSLSRKFVAYALLEQITLIQGTFCFTYDELASKNNEELLRLSNSLLKSLKDYSSDLVDYGIDNEGVIHFQNLINRFTSLIDHQLVAEQINHLIVKTDEILEKKLSGVFPGAFHRNN